MPTDRRANYMKRSLMKS